MAANACVNLSLMLSAIVETISRQSNAALAGPDSGSSKSSEGATEQPLKLTERPSSPATIPPDPDLKASSEIAVSLVVASSSHATSLDTPVQQSELLHTCEKR